MLDSVLRVSGEEFDIDLFLKEYPLSNIKGAYRKGEMGRLKKPYKESGFSVLVSEKLNSSENTLEIQSFVKKHAAAFAYLKQKGINSVIDIGCTVGTKDQFTKSVVVCSALLGLLSEYGVTLEFSAYPASDEENET